MKKTFEIPELDIILFTDEDIIFTSGPGGNDPEDSFNNPDF